MTQGYDEGAADMPDGSTETDAVWRLVGAVQELSLAKTLDEVMAIVRTSARDLARADGATFVLREGDRCYYADESAIAPLWKGRRFPMSACISGWAMANGQSAVIDDIYADERIPLDAYRPTFVKSLVMVPIRTEAPVGAIGTYWAEPRRASPSEVKLLQALANTTSVAMENLQVYAELEKRVAERTRQLEATNRELETFSYSVSHDLRAPVRHIAGFSQLLAQEIGSGATPAAKGYLDRIHAATSGMHILIDDLLSLARIARTSLNRTTVDLAKVAQGLLDNLHRAEPNRRVTTIVEPSLNVRADAGLMRVALENLLSNAWKYTAKRAHAHIEVGRVTQDDGMPAIFVRDNGAGFDMMYSDKLFAPFQRLHEHTEFTGTGVGLATVQRIVHQHGGRIWAKAQPNAGATFWFTIPDGVEEEG